MHFVGAARSALALVPALLATPRAPLVTCICSGDVVQITADVMVKGINANGMVGDIVQDLSVEDEEEWGACCELAFGQAPLEVRLRATVKGYFDNGEFEKLSGSKGSEVQEGDRILVTSDVQVRGGRNANGWEGTVIDVWTGCETDAPCCCNELATVPYTVRLEPPVDSDASESSDPPAQLVGSHFTMPIVGYFEPDELKVLRGKTAK